jgi:hypothetical protein
MNVTELPKRELSIREQAEQEVAKEKAEKAKRQMVGVLREIDAAEAVVKALRMKLADLEQQVADGTL